MEKIGSVYDFLMDGLKMEKVNEALINLTGIQGSWFLIWDPITISEVDDKHVASL